MIKSARALCFVLTVSSLQLVAQVAGPSPLASESSAQVVVPGSYLIEEGRADMALQMGFSSTAAGIYREILRVGVLTPEMKNRVTLSLVTALLDAGEQTQAVQLLQGYAGPKQSAYQLRVGLVAITERRIAQAKSAVAAGRVEELPAADVGWWHYLQAQIAEAENDIERRRAAYAQASATAVSELQRTRFALAQDLALLKRGPLDESRLAALKKTVDDNQGRAIGYETTRLYAAALAAAGRGAEAQTVLQRQLAVIPTAERSWADQLRLVLGMIAGEKNPVGRAALKELLKNGLKPETQRIALQLLSRGATNATERAQLRRDLTELIANPAQQHPIIEDLYLARARLGLDDKMYAAAESDARSLMDQFPGTPLKVEALRVRLAIAWDSQRYRAAADLSGQLRAELAPGQARAELGVLQAEAFFRAPDYKSASGAYEAALRESPLGAPAGDLIFQRVLSDIRANQLESAARQLDEAAANPAFDPLRRWQAEWNLVKEMQVHEQSAVAAGRVDKLLASGVQGVPEDLRVRLMWLRAKLGYDNQQYDLALKSADEVLALMEKTSTLEGDLRENVISSTQLLKAETLLKLEREGEGFDALIKLRKEHPGSAAAQNSFRVQASHLTNRNDLARAQQVLQSFVDAPEYAKSPYVPLALYDIALILDRQGLDRQLREGVEKLEKLVTTYPSDGLVFYARLKQGELLRKLNEFGPARQIYEDLVNNNSKHPDVFLAQIALANTLFAQGGNSVVNFESAVAIFERLRDLPSAPVDLRAEAGYNWGYAIAKRAQTLQGQQAVEQAVKAQAIYWSVVDAFLLDRTLAPELGAKGRYWVARSLLELGQMNEAAGRMDEALRAYQLIVDNKLSGIAQAEAKLARFRPVEAPKS